MDVEPEELQFLGLVGVLSTSSRLVSSNPRHRRLFTQITAALILPLSVLFLAHVLLSHLLFSRIHHDERALDLAPPDSPAEHRLLRLLSSEWSLFLLFKSVYLLFLLVFSLLSVSAVVYSVASIFSAKHDLHFRKVFTVLPKVWRRLMVTFLWAFLFLFAYHVAAAAVLVAFFLLLGPDPSSIGILLILILLLAYFAGLIWISVVWHVASVVSVLEDLCGIGAMKKSRRLIQGKSWLACWIFLLLNLAFAGIEFGFKKVVVQGKGVGGVAGRVGLGLTMWVMLMGVILLGLVAQSVVYFVCKSYHHESIDKSSLADHLEVYLGEYVPLKERDVQMEHYSSSDPAAAAV